MFSITTSSSGDTQDHDTRKIIASKGGTQARTPFPSRREGAGDRAGERNENAVTPFLLSPLQKSFKAPMAGMTASEAYEAHQQRRQSIQLTPKAPVTIAPQPKPVRKLTFQQAVWATFEDPSYSRLAFALSIFIIVLIVISTVAYCLETVEELESPIWGYLDKVCVGCFTLELAVRFASCPSKLVFCKHLMNWVDLMAVLPFYLEFLFIQVGLGEDISSFTILRVVRLVRVFRVLKLSRYSTAAQVFYNSMVQSAQPLSFLMFFMAIAVIIFSSAMFFVEGEKGNKSGKAVFSSIPDAFWWSIVTMTTVGYGDVVPRTPAGKLIAVLAMLTGILVLALPITIIGSNFGRELLELDTKKDFTTLQNDLKETQELQGEMDVDTLAKILMANPMADIVFKKRSVQEVLEMFDADNSGFLDADEVQEVLKYVSKVEKEVVEQMQNPYAAGGASLLGLGGVGAGAPDPELAAKVEGIQERVNNIESLLKQLLDFQKSGMPPPASSSSSTISPDVPQLPGAPPTQEDVVMPLPRASLVRSSTVRISATATQRKAITRIGLT